MAEEDEDDDDDDDDEEEEEVEEEDVLADTDVDRGGELTQDGNSIGERKPYKAADCSHADVSARQHSKRPFAGSG